MGSEMRVSLGNECVWLESKPISYSPLGFSPGDGPKLLHDRWPLPWCVRRRYPSFGPVFRPFVYEGTKRWIPGKFFRTFGLTIVLRHWYVIIRE
jgi:hypothetical protein